MIGSTGSVRSSRPGMKAPRNTSSSPNPGTKKARNAISAISLGWRGENTASFVAEAANPATALKAATQPQAQQANAAPG
jgi:hypothetical protein